MAITFPISPSTGQKFTNGNKVWTWNGNSWKGGITSGGDAGTIDSIDSGSFLRSDQTDTMTGNNQLVFGPNTTWGASLVLGGNGHNQSEAQICATSGNIHIDAKDGQAIYHNWYSTGSTGTYFSDGTGAQRALIASNGSFTNSSTIVSPHITSNRFNGRLDATTGDGQTNSPFHLETDWNSWMVSTANDPATWGLFWAGDTGARYGTNGNGGPGNIWSNSGNPNEFVFVGSDLTRWTLNGNNGNTWQNGSLITVGDITAGGDVITNSDIRLKSDIRSIDDSLGLINSLNGKLYTKDGKKDQLGFIAQEVEQVLPQLVHTANDEMGTKSVNYQGIIALLVETVKELSNKIKELESKLNGV
jgi:hypothetical protein